jgi:hypothetical protein
MKVSRGRALNYDKALRSVETAAVSDTIGSTWTQDTPRTPPRPVESIFPALDERVGGALAKSYQYTPGGAWLSQTTVKTDGTKQDGFYGYNPHTDVETVTDTAGNTTVASGFRTAWIPTTRSSARSRTFVRCTTRDSCATMPTMRHSATIGSTCTCGQVPNCLDRCSEP